MSALFSVTLFYLRRARSILSQVYRGTSEVSSLHLILHLLSFHLKRWFEKSDETTAEAKSEDALDDIKYYFAHIINDVSQQSHLMINIIYCKSAIIFRIKIDKILFAMSQTYFSISLSLSCMNRSDGPKVPKYWVPGLWHTVINIPLCDSNGE